MIIYSNQLLAFIINDLFDINNAKQYTFENAKKINFTRLAIGIKSLYKA